MRLSSVPGKEGVERTQYHEAPGEPSVGPMNGLLVLHQVWKVLILLVLVLVLLPHAASSFQKSSRSQRGPFL